MSAVTEYKPGTFCWADLNTTDAARAKEFYAGLFNWSYVDEPVEDQMVYTMVQLEGKAVAGLCQMSPEMSAQGTPSHWGSYVAVKDADVSATKAAELGGELIWGPVDVYEAGRMALLRDPEGATFSLWQSKQHQGCDVIHEHGTFTWTELMTKDAAGATNFYTQLFGWESDSETAAHLNYTMFTLPERPVAGMLAMSPEMGPLPSNWLVYFAVDDCGATESAARKLGATIHAPTREIADVGHFAVVADPTGAAFGVIKLFHPPE